MWVLDFIPPFSKGRDEKPNTFTVSLASPESAKLKPHFQKTTAGLFIAIFFFDLVKSI